MEDDFDDSEEGLAAREAEYERAAAVAGDLGWRASAPLRAAPGELVWRRLHVPLPRIWRVPCSVRRSRRTSESFRD